MPNNPDEPSKFRIDGDPDLRLTEAEIEAQQAAQDKVRSRLYRKGVLVDLDEDEAKAKLEADLPKQRAALRRVEDVRAGLYDGMRIPDKETLDPDTKHLVTLGEVRPGTEAYAARIPPAEQTIEVIGPKGPEGFGIVKRYDVTGTVELDT